MQNKPRTAHPVQENPEPEPAREAFLKVERVSKSFGPVQAVSDVSLDIRRGELFSLLGGSGCGKTTLLRMLAGFETPSAGRIYIDGRDVTDVPPYERPVNMMFQSYALFPHMSVEKNIAYGLKHEAMSRAQKDERVRAMLDLVQLSDLGRRKPHQISGGQKQRVALARALARMPKVLLLDEPLGALDKKLREQTQFELSNIQQRTGITFVVVTHDQDEAMTLSDRIAVMRGGAVQQIGTPNEVYEYPSSGFVADFIGSINLYDGSVVKSGAATRVRVPALGREVTVASDKALETGQPVQVAIRPEKISIAARAAPGAENVVTGRIANRGYFGKDTLYRVRLESGEILLASNVNVARALGSPLSRESEMQVELSFAPQAVVVLPR
ncbi:polyamine ABC transporter ATP-binding protein [Pseudooceanicola sp. CBS1P-1]|nr:ABC transporter ATP-binding protein [Pseudooceanicola endophyticus]MBT9386854.1 polyamine ABC transporter ATP-binding protein [Pseudooceanicola endophyticus]